MTLHPPAKYFKTLTYKKLHYDSIDCKQMCIWMQPPGQWRELFLAQSRQMHSTEQPETPKSATVWTTWQTSFDCFPYIYTRNDLDPIWTEKEYTVHKHSAVA